MRKYSKIITRTLLIILGLLLIIYIGVYAYITINKADIMKQVTEEIGKRMKGKVTIRDMELSYLTQFPKVAVLLKDVHITDSMFNDHKHVFFSASQFFARLSVLRLIQKKAPLNGLRIEKGALYLYTDSTGYTNTYLLEQKKDSLVVAENSSERNELKSIILKEVNIIIDDRSKEKLHNYFVSDLRMKLDEQEDAVFLLDAKAEIMINSMAFNLNRGSFLKNARFNGKFEVEYSKKENYLKFDSINIKLSGQPFNLSGKFDLKGNAPQFYLRAHSKDVDYKQAKLLMPTKIATALSIVDLDNPLDVNVDIKGPLKGGEPLVFANWKTKKAQLKTPFFDFENASFTGYFTNEFLKGMPRHDTNSVINIDNFAADWRGMPLVASNIRILNLFIPTLTCDLSSKFQLAKLNEVMGSDFLKFQSGDGAVNLTYSGPIERNNQTNSFINGTVNFKNGKLLYTPRNVAMNDLNGELLFKNSDVLVNNVRCVVLNNKIGMQGQAKNLLTLLNTEPGKATIDWSISTPSLNLGDFNFLLKPNKKPSANAGRTKRATTASSIDEVLDKAILHVNLKAGALHYKKFTAVNVDADVTLLENKYLVNKVAMNHAGGSMTMSGSLINDRPGYLRAKINAAMNNVDVSRMLSAFDNFGQDAIMAKNLDGKLTTKVDADLGMDEDGKVFPASIKSTVDFSLRDGALINYEPLKRMQNVIFKNRDLDNIRFAEISNRLEISDRNIKINRMEIQSTAFSFFVEGIYSMKGNTDLSIQVPLNNLKKRTADYNPENIGTDKKGGRSIFLRGRPGADGNVNFKLDLFNKYKKEKTAAEATSN